jgi:hypothetical protein
MAHWGFHIRELERSLESPLGPLPGLGDATETKVTPRPKLFGLHVYPIFRNMLGNVGLLNFLQQDAEK